jgi:hypothetical protein
MDVVNLTKLGYAPNITFPLIAYVYDSSGKHGGRLYFRPEPQVGESSTDQVRKLVAQALRNGLEVRITNGSDYLVYHQLDGIVVYPSRDPDQFWISAGASE